MKIPVAIFSSVFIFLIAAFSALATHDYLSWNRSRWVAWDYATNTLKVSPHHIDGGYECNGWVLGRSYDPIHNKAENDNEYLLSIGEVAGYNMVKQFPCQNYLPYGVKNICLLHRK